MKKRFLLYSLFLTILFNIDGVSAAEYVQCGEITGIPSGLPVFTRNIINLIKIAVPIILCVMGMIDFAKAVIAGDEKSMSEGPKKFIKRVISAILVFFVVAIVQFIFNVLGESDTDKKYVDEDSFNSCLKCFISDESGCSEDTKTQEKIDKSKKNNTTNNSDNNKTNDNDDTGRNSGERGNGGSTF